VMWIGCIVVEGIDAEVVAVEEELKSCVRS
jgi:hypothetical protein